eukprot:89830_1
MFRFYERLLALTLFAIISHGQTITISAARALADQDTTDYTVQGTVTSTPGAFRDLYNSENGYGFFIQDGTGGILVYVELNAFYEGTDLLDDLVLGREVTVTGPIDTNTGPVDVEEGGTVRIKPVSDGDIVLGDAGDAIEPETIELDEIKAHQGKLVRIEDVNITHLLIRNQWGADYRAFDVNDDEKTTSIYLYPFWNQTNSFPVVGQEYEYIDGIAAVFLKRNKSHVLEEEWELWPRSEGDFYFGSDASKRRMSYAIAIVTMWCLYRIV